MNTESYTFQEPERLKKVQFSAIRTMLDKAAALREQGKTVIALSAGEPNFNTPEPIKQATIRAIRENFTHYGSNRGLPKLRQQIAGRIEAETGVSYDPATELVFTTGGAEALNNILLATVDEGDEVIIPSPAFVTYRNLTRLCGAVPVEIPVKAENHFHLDLQEIADAITPKTKMIIINNPNNPTGAVYSREELEGLAKLAVEHDLLVLADEMYSSLVYRGEFVPFASLPGMKTHAIVVNGFSKTYAMTGWRLGYLYADRSIVTAVMKVHQYSSTCSPTFIQVGMAAAIEDPQTDVLVGEMVQAFHTRCERITKELSQVPDIAFCEPEGAFYCLVDVSKTGLTGEAFADRLLEEKCVAVVPAVSLGKEDTFKDYIRISFAASEEDIIEGVRRIRILIEEMKSE